MFALCHIKVKVLTVGMIHDDHGFKQHMAYNREDTTRYLLDDLHLYGNSSFSVS